MNPWIVATVFGCLAVLAAFSVVRDLRTGVARSFVGKYHVGENPVGYVLCLLSDVGVLALGVAAVLHALGIIGNPIDAINSVLPPFLRCSKGDPCGP